ncbi:MAG: hypothetical protein LAN70_17820 [Acidobacteriia bacterium]|nr:hypothetical protein [Terriglobia bacterium]
MKAISRFIIALLLLIAGLWTLLANFAGNMNLNVAWPLSSCSFEVSGSAKGVRVVAALALLVAAVFAFLWALISAIARRLRTPARDVPPTQSLPKA